jgi:hypothetical protein
MADTDNAHRNLRIYFRFVGLSGEHLDRVRETLASHAVQVADRKRRAGQRAEVVAIPIDERFPVAAVASLVQELGLSSDSYGVYISLVTESDQDGLTVPEPVLRVIREVGGQLDFSFTCV